MSDYRKPDLSRSELPGGTVTFLFTDIEGSTELLKRLRDQYALLLADYRGILRERVAQWNGQEVDAQGDALFVSFPRATDAVSAVVDMQKSLRNHKWPKGVELQARMGVHTGEPLVVDEGYIGMDVHRAARIAHVGHGGQILLSETTSSLVRDELPNGVNILDLGRHRLKDMRRPEHIVQLVIEDLPSKFPPLASLEALPPEITLEPFATRLPAFLEEDVAEVALPVFVGRERELDRLEEFLSEALAGNGTIAFITGDPGRGKTAIMQHFTRQIISAHPDLLVSYGVCRAYTGVGDPYLPFREVMEMLTGDLEPQWDKGTILREHAVRLWEAIPKVIQALLEHGPKLIDVFVNGRNLLARANAALEDGRNWIERLSILCDAERIPTDNLKQSNLFEQYEDVLGEISNEHPLVLMLDDLQWTDNASISLLFHLSRQLSGKRIFILGAFRPEEVALGRGGDAHPLEKVLAEVKRQFGDVCIGLSESSQREDWNFLEAYLDSEPNQLSEDFRRALYRHTGGHPLFTVELLRNMQEQGALIQDNQGRWIEDHSLDWMVLPARVEGVIEERIGRLKETLQEILRIASVEGENFTAQVVARVQKVDELQLFGKLNRELEKRYRLVFSQGEAKVGEHILSQYSFSHALFQQFMYNGLSSGERRLMHSQVAQILEELYAGVTNTIAVQLAHHYTRAEQFDKAIHYLLIAGDQARIMAAHDETVDFYKRALEIMKERGEYELAARTLMKLGLAYHDTLNFKLAQQMFDEGFEMRKRVSLLKQAATPSDFSTYRRVWYEMATLDPTLNLDLFSKEIFSGLVEQGTVREIIPDRAASWEISKDGLRYIFQLRDDVFWTDGKQVTSRDFEFAWKRILNPSTGSSADLVRLLFEIQGAESYHRGENSDPDKVGIRAIDDLTLEIELEKPASFFLHLLTALYPVPKHVVETFGVDWTELNHIVTNGPFRVETYQPGESMVLTRNPTFHGHFPGNLEKIEFLLNVPIASPESLAMYEADQVDLVNLSEQTYYARHKYPEEYLPFSWPGITYVAFNSNVPPFDDKRVRLAFVMAVDKERITSEELRGFYDLSFGGFVPPGMPGHSPDIGLAYDPEQARNLLSQAGHPDGLGFQKLHFVIHSEYSESRLGEGISQQWSENLNVDVAIEILDSARLCKEKNLGNCTLGGWLQDYPDPDNFLRVCIQTALPYWQNNVYDQLLDEARRTILQEKRIRLYQAADQVLIEEAVVLPITYTRHHCLVKPWDKNPDWTYGPQSWKVKIVEPH
jgi:ABC-type oligopeptide transport system substrate-binding subunit/class 3 adenylate cyclase/tetratricopeptide (TPR) repeat protein